MLSKIITIFNESIRTKQESLEDKVLIEAVKRASETIIATYKNNGKVIIFGNGGSAADSQHMAAEFLVRFEKERKSLPAIALNTNTSTITAAGNDYDFTKIFSRQMEAFAEGNDCAFAISTSGNSANVIEAVKTAKAKGLSVVGLLGKDGGALSEIVDIPIIVKSPQTARIQEIHVLIIHIICKLVEEEVG